MNKTLSVLTALTALTLMSVASVYAVEVWRWTTIIHIMEPFEVHTTLPTDISLYPGSYSYTINVTNHGGETLNATLYYSIAIENCTVTIAPTNGTSYPVMPMSSVTFPVTINITLDVNSTNGTATIDWRIERTSW